MKAIQCGKQTIETPCHQLLNYEEYDYCCDVVLDGYYALSVVAVQVIRMLGLTYIVAILNIEEAPEAASCKSSCCTNVLPDHIHRHNGVDDCKPSIER